jgi:hypothetical protein
MKNRKENKMKKYKVYCDELGYEEIIEAKSDYDAEIQGMVHCKQYLQNYVYVWSKEIKEQKGK